MSERPSIDDILAHQRAERQRTEEQQQQQEEESKQQTELMKAFDAVRYCTQQDLSPGTDFEEEFARRFTELVCLLSERGELERLV